MKSFSLLMSLAFFGLSAFAGELPAAPYLNAQRTHQAESGSFELTPGLILGFFTLKSSSSPASIDVVNANENLTGEYGLNEMFSLGAKLTYVNTASTVNNCLGCSGFKREGLADPEVAVKFKAGVGPGTLKFILGYSFSTGKSTTDTSNKSNASSGGDAANLAAAYEFQLNKNSLLGFSAAYDIWKQDRSYSNDNSSGPPTTGKYKGGNGLSVAAYYEYLYHRVTFGGSLSYSSVQTTKAYDDGSSSGDATTSPTSMTSLGFYIPVLTGGSITLYPQIEYAHATLQSGAGFNDYDVVALAFKARFVF